MKSILYWSPFFSNVATIKNVLNSAYSLKKYNSHYSISLIDTIGEWKDYQEDIREKKIEILNLSKKCNLSNYYPIEGFLKTRILSVFIFIFFFFKLKNLLINKNPDFLIINLLTALPLTLLFLFKFETKIILRISGLPRLNFFRKFLWKIVSKKIYLVTCPSEETKKKIEDSKIFNKLKVKLLYDPIIVIKDIKKRENEKLNFNDFFLNIGRLTYQKNQKLILQSFKKENFKNLLLILGDGEQKSDLENFILKNQLKNNVKLIGFRNNVFQYLKKAKAVIVSSLWEDPGAVMIEAAFSNCTIISSDCKSGPKEFIGNNVGGYLFQNNSILELSKVIKKFLNDDTNIIFKKKIIAKKKCRKYSLYFHYKVLDKYLSY